jgi:hypothetical protein
MGDYNVDAKLDEFFRELLGAIASSVGIAELNRNVLAFRIAKGVQTAPEGVGEWMRRRRGYQHADARQFSDLLRECSTWRAEQSNRQDADQIAPSHMLSPRSQHGDTAGGRGDGNVPADVARLIRSPRRRG